MKTKRRGVLFILSGPSGAGKGTLRDRLFKMIDGLSFSVSCTTRSPRAGEIDGVDYHFITEEQFLRRREAGEFLEWAGVHGHFYGTLVSDVQKALDDGHDILLEIDVQGALQVKNKMPDAVTIFVAPPSMKVLEERLRGRSTESEQDIALRLCNARREMEESTKYDFTVVNDDLDTAAGQLAGIVRQYRTGKER
ncbi:MAG: guanylate kinase [Pyramidobacter sp.]|jgi:guanylate kinase